LAIYARAMILLTGSLVLLAFAIPALA